jgi:hypothetical protein
MAEDTVEPLPMLKEIQTIWEHRGKHIDCYKAWDAFVAQHFRALLDELNRLQRLEYCVVKSLAGLDDTEPRDEPGPICGPAWSKVGYVCGLGSNSAARLCIKHGVDPNYDCANDREEEPEEEEE